MTQGKIERWHHSLKSSITLRHYYLLSWLQGHQTCHAAGEEVNVPLPFASILRDNYLDALAHGDVGPHSWSPLDAPQ